MDNKQKLILIFFKSAYGDTVGDVRVSFDFQEATNSYVSFKTKPRVGNLSVK